MVEQNSNDPGLPINMQNLKIRLLNRDGYRFTHMFCGVMPVGFELVGKSCQLIFERSDGRQELPATAPSATSATK